MAVTIVDVFFFSCAVVVAKSTLEWLKACERVGPPYILQHPPALVVS